jgi:hypothetical protein
VIPTGSQTRRGSGSKSSHPIGFEPFLLGQALKIQRYLSMRTGRE